MNPEVVNKQDAYWRQDLRFRSRRIHPSLQVFDMRETGFDRQLSISGANGSSTTETAVHV